MMFEPRCCENCRDNLIVIEEQDKKLVVSNSTKARFCKVRYDGCVVEHKTAADRILVHIAHKLFLLVELKGRNVEHAMLQLRSTVNQLIDQKVCLNKMASVIICREYPHARTRLQKLEEGFRRDFNIPLTIAASYLKSDYGSLFKHRRKRKPAKR